MSPAAAQPASSGSSQVSAQIPALPFLQMSSEMPLPQEGLPDPWAQPTYTLRTWESGQAAATPSTDRSGEIEGLPVTHSPAQLPPHSGHGTVLSANWRNRRGDTGTQPHTSVHLLTWVGQQPLGVRVPLVILKVQKQPRHRPPSLPLLGRADTPVPL